MKTEPPTDPITPDLETVLAQARLAIASAPSPAAALRRLAHHVQRERTFAASPAAVPVDAMVAARTGGFPAHLAAGLAAGADHPAGPLPGWAL